MPRATNTHVCVCVEGGGGGGGGGGGAPQVMFGEAAAVNGSVAYFQPGGLWECTVLAYDSATSNWSELPRCPNHYFSLAVVNNLVTVIGGRTPQDEYTSSLLSLTDEEAVPRDAHRTLLHKRSVQWQVSSGGRRTRRRKHETGNC